MKEIVIFFSILSVFEYYPLFAFRQLKIRTIISRTLRWYPDAKLQLVCPNLVFAQSDSVSTALRVTVKDGIVLISVVMGSWLFHYTNF